MQRERLDALPGWVSNTREASWEDGYARLRQFAEREGHTRVSQCYRDADGYPLGLWVHHQRVCPPRPRRPSPPS